MNTDQALSLLGRYSKWQIKCYIILAVGFSIPFAWMSMSVVFIGDTPNHRCALPPNTTLNDTIPSAIEDGNLVYSQCEMYVNLSVDNRTQSCTHGYWYDPSSGYQKTIVSEWDLVCGKGWLVELSMTLSNIGSAVGTILFTRLSDLYGRKPIFLGCMWANAITATTQAFSPNYIFYTTMSFFDGLLEQGIMSSACILALELFPTAQRTFPINAIEYFWAFGYMSIVPFAYFIRHWRWLQIAITAPLLLTISFYWLVEESIPWLMANGKYPKADRILRIALEFNGKPQPVNEMLLSEENVPLTNVQHEKQDGQSADRGSVIRKLRKGCHCKESTNGDHTTDDCVQSSEEYGVFDIFRSSVLRKYTLAFLFIWFANGLGYYSINLTVTYLPGDRYLNTFLYALLEIPAYAVSWILMHKVGRRLPLCVFHLIAGAALVGTMIQTFDFYGPHLQPLSITLSMIGKFGITMSFATIYVNTPEIYPTNVRTIGLGICQLTSRIAMNIAPYSRTLYRSIPWLPPLIIGVMSIAAGFLALILPETRKTTLPESIMEVEEWNTTRNKPAEK